jgi:hypothetical protein
VNRRSFAALLVGTTLLSGACAGASSPNVPEPRASTHPTNRVVATSRLVLHPADLGDGWAAVSLAQQLAQDRDRGPQDIERRSFRGAYKAFSVAGNHDGVLSEATEYASTSDATTLYHAQADLGPVLAKSGQRRVAVPADSPGSDPILITGRLPVAGVETPSYILLWRHGRVVETLILFGPNADVSLAHIVAVAKHQDRLAATAGL